ncbi:MAG TPA: ABC transporter permease [Methylibium sp.]|uniref:ABC transporter permease n=1 Tax=Methylibium sp. TaxID=2067992 RepID=UPI002DB84B20|nr:ABC transporter permease [Methylibium sp.]HEU4457612.1 ABC transporter permease [Methylibium sp.]
MLHGYAPALLEGLGLTLAVALASLLIAGVLGLACASARLARSRVLRGTAATYTTLVRGVPDLVLMLLVFYGGQMALNAVALRLGHEEFIDVDPFVAGVLTIGFVFGAYFAETFRGAFLALPAGQREAGLACGMGRMTVLRRIELPQMLRHALPALSNNWLVLVKSTAIVSVIGLNDVMLKAGQAAGSTREPFVFYGAAALLYLAVTGASELGFKLLDRRLQLGVRTQRL